MIVNYHVPIFVRCNAVCTDDDVFVPLSKVARIGRHCRDECYDIIWADDGEAYECSCDCVINISESFNDSLYLLTETGAFVHLPINNYQDEIQHVGYTPEQCGRDK